MKRWLHRVMFGAHCVYFGLVAVEAHGFYGMAALALLVLHLAEAATGE